MRGALKRNREGLGGVFPLDLVKDPIWQSYFSIRQATPWTQAARVVQSFPARAHSLIDSTSISVHSGIRGAHSAVHWAMSGSPHATRAAQSSSHTAGPASGGTESAAGAESTAASKPGDGESEQLSEPITRPVRGQRFSLERIIFGVSLTKQRKVSQGQRASVAGPLDRLPCSIGTTAVSGELAPNIFDSNEVSHRHIGAWAKLRETIDNEGIVLN